MKLPDAVFHYTVGPKLPLILKSRRLQPTGFGLAASSREKPVLWWSENADWEQTATKVLSTDRGKTYRRPSLAELQAEAGLYRFRLDTRNAAALHEVGIKLVPWQRIPMLARIDPKDVQRMLMSGLHLGATPTQWWGTFEPVPTSLEVSGVLTVEHRDANAEGLARDQWVPVDGGLLAATKAFIGWMESKGLRIDMRKASDEPAARNI